MSENTEAWLQFLSIKFLDLKLPLDRLCTNLALGLRDQTMSWCSCPALVFVYVFSVFLNHCLNVANPVSQKQKHAVAVFNHRMHKRTWEDSACNSSFFQHFACARLGLDLCRTCAAACLNFRYATQESWGPWDTSVQNLQTSRSEGARLNGARVLIC